MNVPKGWQIKKVQDDFETFSGGTPSTSNPNYYGGNIPWIRSTEINQSKVTHTEKFITKEGLTNSSAKLVYPGYLLLALYGATAGEVAITEIEGAINQAVLSINNTNQRSSNSYLYYYLSFYKNRIINKFVQGGQPNLSGGIIKNINFLAPPLEEQQKIASILSTWDEAISLYGKLSNQVEQYKMILLKQLTDVKYLNESLKVKTREVSFSKAYSRIAIGKNKIKKSEYLSYENGKIPVIDQSQKYIAGYSNMEDKIIYADKENPLIVFGDHTRVIKQIDFEFITGADGVVVLAHNSELLDSSYAYHLLLSLEIPDTGYNRHYKFLEETIFDIPNLEAQRKLGKILDEFDAYLKQLNLMISYLQEQKRGLMQLLLTGKVRV